jgi:hypothetical protein
VDGDPCVGKFLEFRVREYAGRDLSMDPADYVAGRKKLLPLPRPSASELAHARHRTFDFVRSGGTDEKPWTIKTDGGAAFGMDFSQVSAAPNIGELSADGLGHLEVWKITTGGGWSHPIHSHFEEGIILTRDGAPPPEWEKWARKDVYRIGDGPDSSREIEFTIRFREFAGTYMEHCHNTQHEDTAMLLRWDIERPGQFTLLPAPVPGWDGVQYVPSVSLPTARTGDGFGPGGGVEPPPPPGEVLTVTSAQYSTTRGWRIRGTSTASDIRVRARVGSTLAGAIIGSGVVAADGAWTVRAGLSAPAPDAGRTVSLESQGGATLLAVPVELVP